MANFYEDNEDLRFYMTRGIDWEPLVRLTEYEYKSEEGFENCKDALEFYEDLLNLVGTFTADEIAPHAAVIDREHPTVVDGEVQLPPVQEGIFEQLNEMAQAGHDAVRRQHHAQTEAEKLESLLLQYCQ